LGHTLANVPAPKTSLRGSKGLESRGQTDMASSYSI
jgi:hypothetical protein